MKQFLCFSFFMLCFCGVSLGQGKFDYTASKPYQVIDGGEKYYFSRWDEDYKEKTLSIKRDGKDIYMQSFDATSMVEVKRNKISDLPKGYDIENISWFGKKLYFFFSLWDKEKETEQLFVREVDFDGCSFKGANERLIAVEGRLTGAPAVIVGFWGVGVLNKFSFLLSKDKSKMLIQYRRKPEKKRDDISYDIIGMFVFDENLKKIAGNDVKMPYTEKMMDNVDYSVDSEGNPYILAKVRADGSDKDTKGSGKNKEANYHIELFKVNVATSNIRISKVEIKDNFIKDIWLYEGLDNVMLCSGFYNKKVAGNWSFFGRNINEADVDGIFLFKLNKDGGIDDEKYYEIPVEILNQYTTAGSQKSNEKKDQKGKAEFANLVLRSLEVQEDGSIIITGEQYYVVVTYDSKGRARYTYYYNDMLVTKINTDGGLDWMRKLPKRQIGSQPRGGMGFHDMKIGDNHYFVFLDNVKNMSLSIDKRPAAHRDGAGGFLTAYKIDDASGKVEKFSILDTKKIAEGYSLYQFNTGRILEVSEDEFITEFYVKGKKDIMIKVKVK